MAKQANGYLGGFNGKLGPAIGYCWNGKWCLRARPQAVRNPRTEAQVMHREAFKAQVQLAARMRRGVMAGMTAEARQMGMTAYNLFVSLNQQAFSIVDGVMATDYSLLQVSCGPVAPVAFGEAAIDENNVLTVSFEPNPLRMRAGNYDGVRIYAYSPSLGSGYLSAPVYRRSKRLCVSLPDEFAGQELHIYGFVQDEEGRCSETEYIYREPHPQAPLLGGEGDRMAMETPDYQLPSPPRIEVEGEAVAMGEKKSLPRNKSDDGALLDETIIV